MLTKSKLRVFYLGRSRLIVRPVSNHAARRPTGGAIFDGRAKRSRSFRVQPHAWPTPRRFSLARPDLTKRKSARNRTLMLNRIGALLNLRKPSSNHAIATK